MDINQILIVIIVILGIVAIAGGLYLMIPLFTKKDSRAKSKNSDLPESFQEQESLANILEEKKSSANKINTIKTEQTKTEEKPKEEINPFGIKIESNKEENKQVEDFNDSNNKFIK